MNRAVFTCRRLGLILTQGQEETRGGHTLNDEIVICKECKKPEYWGEMRWLSGRCVCRDCYKANYEQETKEPYTGMIWTGNVQQ